MALWFELISFFTNLVLPMVVGYVLARGLGVRQAVLDRLMPVGMLAAVPALTLLTFWGMALEPRLAWLPVLGVVMLVVPGLAAGLQMRLRADHDALDRGTYVIASMLANRGVVGGLTVYILFGEQGYAWSQMVVIFGPAFVFMISFPLAGWYRRKHLGELGGAGSIWSVIFSRNQVPVLGILAGLALNLAEVPRPEGAGTVVSMLVFVMAWLFLVPTGAALDFSEMRRYWRDLLDMLAIKFLLTPALLGGLVWAMGFRGELLWTLIILAASPTAIFTILVARMQGLNLHMAMAAYVLTHVVYLVVVFPLVLAVIALTG